MNENFDAAFDNIVNQAKALKRPVNVIIAGADVENILLGAFDAEEAGFVHPILVGNEDRINSMLDKLGLKDRNYDLQPISDDMNCVQYAIEMIDSGNGDVLMRGNTQTRDFLMPILNKGNHLLYKNLMTHVVMTKIPGCNKLTAISDVTFLVDPSVEKRKDVIRNMVRALRMVGVENPNIAVLALVEKPSFHMKDTVEAQTIVLDHKDEPIAPCNLVGPIPYDLIVSKEAARLKGYDCPYCGEFDGILVPNLATGNLLIKVLMTSAQSSGFGIIMGAKIPIAITSRSDAKEQAFLSLAACAVMAQRTLAKDNE